MDTGEEMLRLGKAAALAWRQMGKSVVQANGDFLLDAAAGVAQGKAVHPFGVKNTGQIRREYLARLARDGSFVWHTVDGMADGGRAVHLDLVNPLTGRWMTGSSGAGAVNVLLGVNDLAVGTDGGGSVLAPALSLNLFSIMAGGLGLTGDLRRQSTDGISFVPGVGVISPSLALARQAVERMLDEKLPSPGKSGVAAVCRPGCLRLPDGSDMGERLAPAAALLERQGWKIELETLPDGRNRGESIARLRQLLARYDLVLSWEGPVDLAGMGDSVFGVMGPAAAAEQNRSGKYLVRVANMAGATAVTIPAGEVSSGLVITAPAGANAGSLALAAAECLEKEYPLPELYGRYFREGYRRRENALVFSLPGEGGDDHGAVAAGHDLCARTRDH